MTPDQAAQMIDVLQAIKAALAIIMATQVFGIVLWFGLVGRKQ